MFGFTEFPERNSGDTLPDSVFFPKLPCLISFLCQGNELSKVSPELASKVSPELLSVIAGVKNPEKPRDTFYVPKERERPFFILEVVSPIYRKADTERKPEIYRKAGVSEYVIVDPGLKDNKIS